MRSVIDDKDYDCHERVIWRRAWIMANDNWQTKSNLCHNFPNTLCHYDFKYMKPMSGIKMMSALEFSEAIFDDDLNIGNDFIGIIFNLFLLCGRVFTIKKKEIFTMMGWEEDETLTAACR